ncbi:type II secretion system minor pseudopilin GspI [Rhizobium sp. CRIBSB]|nr:type II secretion system minor pseudopilin GspI [Rhizobium sp. CRIBSB]
MTVRPDHPRPGRSRQGFTLLEVLVALAVFSLMAVALLHLAGENTRSAARVEARVLGGMVAENLAVQAYSLPNPPALGRTEGSLANAGRTWRWIQDVARTDDPGILRIDVRVADADGQVADVTLFRDTGA